MGDVGEFWNDVGPGMRADSQAKRANNREWSSTYLKEHGIPFETRNEGVHLIINKSGRRADFWPGTGKWVIRGRPGHGDQHGRGVRGLVRILERETA